MATRYYIGAGNDWNNNAYWSTTSGGSGGSSFPTASDIAIFDGNSGACVLDADAACSKLQLGRSGSVYNAKLDFGSKIMAIGTGGMDATYGSGASCILDLGSSQGHTCSGSWLGVNLTSLDDGTSLLDLTGSAKTFTHNGDNFTGLTISGSYTLNAGTSFVVFGAFTVSGTLTITAGITIDLRDDTDTTGGTINLNHADAVLFANLGGGVPFTQAGTITGTLGTFTLASGALTNTGTISPPYIIIELTGSPTWSGGIYTASGGLTIQNTGTTDKTLVWGTAAGQTYTITGNLLLKITNTGDMELNLSTNNPAIVLAGGVSFSDTGAGVFRYTGSTTGTSTLTIVGTADVNLVLPSPLTWPAITINRGSDTAETTLVSDMSAAGFTATRGRLNLNACNLVVSAGNPSFSTTGGFQFSDGLGGYDQSGSVIQLTGASQTLTLAGTSGTLLQIDSLNFTLPASTTVDATYCRVGDSDVTGLTIDATDGTSVDLGGNTGWDISGGEEPPASESRAGWLGEFSLGA
jgi:hypothetical protein